MAFNPFDSIANNVRSQANRAIGDLRNQAQQTVSNFVGDKLNTGIGFIDNAIDKTINNAVGGLFNPGGFNSSSRSRNLPTATGITGRTLPPTTASWSSSGKEADWRVKLSVPEQFNGSTLLAPLINQTGGALVFPYTPTIIIGHSANYNTLDPVHSNYPFQVYQNSSVDDIVVTGEFTVENETEGQYWVAAIHFLRSITKMFYGGEDENTGAPPLLTKLSGYGDYVFNQVPCVVTNFTVDLPADVDYIATSLSVAGGSDPQSEIPDVAGGVTWAPTRCQITITLRPTYSRRRVAGFNLNEFVNGKYVTDGTGFI